MVSSLSAWHASAQLGNLQPVTGAACLCVCLQQQRLPGWAGVRLDELTGKLVAVLFASCLSEEVKGLEKALVQAGDVCGDHLLYDACL